MKNLPGGGQVQVSNLPGFSLGGSGTELQNDGYYPGAPTQSLPEYRPGDEVAGVFGPVSAPFRVVKVFLCARQNNAGLVDLFIYTDAGRESPGLKICSGTLPANCSAGQFRECDLANSGILIQGGSIRVSLKARQDGIPPVPQDADGLSRNGRNWYGRGGDGLTSPRQESRATR